MPTHRVQWNRRNGYKDSKSHTIRELARITRISKTILNKVYKRGIGAHATNIASVRMKGSFQKNPKASAKFKLSANQWAMARVYAFLNKLEKGNLNHDCDLAKSLKKRKRVNLNHSYELARALI